MHFKNKTLSIKYNLGSIFLGIVIWAFILFPSFAFSQGTSDVDPSLKRTQDDLSPVQLDGEVLFYVRGVSAYPSAIRAATIKKRILNVAKNYSFSVDSLKVMKEAGHNMVYAGYEFIMNVYETDGEAEGVNKDMLAEIIKVKIKEAIEHYRQYRSPESIKANIIKAIVGLVMLLTTLLVLLWLFRKINRGFNQRLKHRIERLENVSFKLIQSNQLLKLLSILYQVVRTIIIALIIILFLNYILGLFPWTRGVSKYAFTLILNPLKWMGKGFLNYLPSLIFLIVIFLVTHYALKLIKLFFIGLRDGEIVLTNFYPEWAIPTFKIVRFLVIIFALVIAFPYIPGSGSSAFQGISVFLGILFSLGSSSFIANIIAGYSMTFRRAFKIGDRIQVNDQTGFVENQSLMVTRLRTVKNEEIIIPNSTLLNSTVLNYSHYTSEKGIILHTTVGIGYETSWRKVDAMLKLAADRTEGLLKEPPPFVLKKTLGDFAITYEINAYCNDVSKLLTHYSNLHQNILDLFNENNVQIMTPAYEGDPDIPKVVPKEEWNSTLANEGKSDAGPDKKVE